jgi:hypothetical protein
MKSLCYLKSAICNLQFAFSSFQRFIVLIGLILFLSSAVPVLAQLQEGRSLDGELLKNLKTQSKNDIEREVFGAGEKGKKDKLQNRAGQGGADLNEQLQRELGAAAEKEDDNPLLNIAQNMFQVRQRITQNDAGPATLNLQKQIVADLDLLIEQARKSAGQCSSSSSNPQQPTDSPPKPGAGASQKPGNKPAASSSPRPPDNQRHKPDMEEMHTMMNNLWGELPAHVREQMLQSPVEEFIPKYEQLIEDYFRELSDEKKSGE